MSNMPKVSVVVPVYGVEKYIERCARSLFEQTLEDMEFVFVDDCTKDNSIAILEKVILDYPKRKDQIKIIHHEQNKGLSHARETGVKNATGDFIGHCDSDDWVDKNMYEEMYLKAKQDGCDFVKCGHKKTDGIYVIETNFVFGAEMQMTSIDAIRFLLQFRGWNSIWDTLVKKDLYNLVEFTNDSMLEDLFVTSQLLAQAPIIGIVNKPFYSYFINNESICRVPSDSARINRVNQAQRNLNTSIFRLKKTLKNDELRSRDIITAKWFVKNMMVPYMTSSMYYSVWRAIYPEIDYRLLFVNTISVRNKVRFYFAHFHLLRFLKH